jgi:2'-hydroxyisoflavone reductase
VFVSSVSVYPTHETPDADETQPVATMADPTVESMGANYENYGALKALCEQAAEAALPGKVANVRPGYIVGPRDPTPRWTYWPARVARGGAMLAPGKPADPIQLIDVRDLGEWLVTLVEQRTAGVFNAVGPAQPIAMEKMLDECKRGVGGDASYVWVPASFLEQHGVEVPIWIAPRGEHAGFHRRSNARAVAAGLKFRAVSDTARATHEWLATLPEEERAKLTGAIPAAREAELLAAWSAAAPK